MRRRYHDVGLTVFQPDALPAWRWFARWRASRAGTCRWVVHYGEGFSVTTASRATADRTAAALRAHGGPELEGYENVRVERVR